MVRRAIMGFLILAVLVGCAKGRSVPTVTKMVTFDQADGLSFDFGSTAFCKDGVEENTCEELGHAPITFPTVKIKLAAFAIDEHEVTNLQYVHCVAHGACTEPKFGNTGKYDDSTGGIAKYYDDKGNEYDNHPVVNVTHTQAAQFCKFVGKRLPTEFEWELAAKSERDLDKKNEDTSNTKTIYPWNSKLVSECVNKDVAIGRCNKDYGLPQAVKSMTDDVIRNGEAYIYDMAGNVMEWVADRWDEQITCQPNADDGKIETEHEECLEDFSTCLGKCALAAACTGYDPTKVLDAASIEYVGGGDFAYRGASYFTDDLCKARTTSRMKPKFSESIKSNVDLGFRCACTVDDCPK
ncbi:MAG TPA: hypothetical protein EYN06_02915 [Myxococcales bacterium]|nr:hypothetical protein [Myxococcales bacterium]HIN85406.1 hypothetical protein [Myxococcales bacterium]